MNPVDQPTQDCDDVAQDDSGHACTLASPTGIAVEIPSIRATASGRVTEKDAARYLGMSVRWLRARRQAIWMWVFDWVKSRRGSVGSSPPVSTSASSPISLIATIGFLYLPLYFMKRRGEDYSDYGVTLANWEQDVKLFLILLAITVPLYVGGFLLFFEILPHLPAPVRGLLSPFRGTPITRA